MGEVWPWEGRGLCFHRSAEKQPHGSGKGNKTVFCPTAFPLPFLKFTFPVLSRCNEVTYQ